MPYKTRKDSPAYGVARKWRKAVTFETGICQLNYAVIFPLEEFSVRRKE